jgi:hypothetical protein
MRRCILALVSAYLAFAALGCNEDTQLTVLFTGDEHDFISPAG